MRTGFKNKSNKLSILVPILLISTLGFIIYFNTLNSPLQFDDLGYIKNNPHIKSFYGLGYYLKVAGTRGRILTFATFALNYFLNGYDVVGYHIVNIAIHILNALLVMWLVNQLLLTSKFNGTYIRERRGIFSLVTALLFVSHPIETQAVSYLTQRFASLATFFYLLSICSYLKARLKFSLGKSRVIFFTISVFAALMGMLSKETVFTLPIIIVICEVIFFRDKEDSLFQRKSNIVWFSLFILGLLIIVPAFFNMDIGKIIFHARNPSESHVSDIITSYNYFLTQMRVIPVYLKLIVYPVNQNLLYDFPLSKSILEIKTLLGFIFLLSLLCIGFFSYKKHPLMSFGIVWFFVTSSVESSFIPIRHVIFEHRMYLPSVGIFMCISYIAFMLLRNARRFIILFVIIIAVLSLLTIRRNVVWSDEVLLWEDVARGGPKLAKPYINLSRAYLKKRDLYNAMKNINIAIEYNPYSDKAYNNKGIIYHQARDYRRAIKNYNVALKINKNNYEAFYNRGLSFAMLKDQDAALQDFTSSLEHNNFDDRPLVSRAMIYNDRGDLQKALKDLNSAEKLNPFNKDVYVIRSIVFRKMGEYEKALRDINKSIRIDPNTPVLYNIRGNIFLKSGRIGKAIENYTTAISINKKNPLFYLNRGLAYKRKGMLQEALKDFKVASEGGVKKADIEINEIIGNKEIFVQ